MNHCYPKAIKNLHLLLQSIDKGLAQEPNSEFLLFRRAETLIGLGTCYKNNEQPDSSLLYLQKGLAFAKRHNLPAPIMRGHLNIASYYVKLSQKGTPHLSYIKPHLDSAALYLPRNSKGMTLLYQKNIAQYQLLNKEYAQCIKTVQSILPTYVEQENISDQQTCYELLYQSYDALNQPQQAYESYKIFTLLKDSIDRKTLDRQMSIYEIDSQIKDKTIQNLKLQEHTKLLSQRSYLMAWGIALLSVLMLISAWLAIQWRKQAYKNAQLNNQLQKNEESLRDSNYKLNRFTSTVTHDILSSLDLMLTTGHVLVGDQPRLDRLERYYQQSQHIAKQLKTYCWDLLQLARKNTSDRQIVDFNKLVEEILFNYNAKIKFHNISLEVLPLPKLNTNPTICKQALQNIIDNAIKYASKAHSPQITISAQTQSDTTSLTIADNGPGITEEGLQKMWASNPKTSSASDDEANGIGLALTRQNLAEINCDLSAQINEWGGTSFSLTFN